MESLNKNNKLVKEMDIYAQVVFHLSADTATKLTKKYDKADIRSLLVWQVVSFCLIALNRRFVMHGLSPQKRREIVSGLVAKVAHNTSQNAEGEKEQEEVYSYVVRWLNRLMDTYGNMPLKNKDSESQGGTLLWEYGKLVAKTLGQGEELSAMMACSSAVANTSKAIDTDKLIKAASQQKGEAKASKNLAWYWISLAGVIGAILGGLIGGGAGALITILGGHLLLLISLVSAVSGGIYAGRKGKVTAGSRIGAFFIALLIALIALGINGAL